MSKVGWSVRVPGGAIVAALVASGPAWSGQAVTAQAQATVAPVSPVCPARSGGEEGTPSVAHYPRSQNGRLLKPDRILAGPHTLLCHPRAVTLGPSRELYVLDVGWSFVVGPAGLQEWVSVYPSTATGDVAPTRILIIENWRRLNRAFGIRVDAKNFVYILSDAPASLDSGSVAVFEVGANGDADPVRVLSGVSTGLRHPRGLALDAQGNLYVTNAPREDADTVRMFASGATGNVAPTRIIAGANTRLDHPLGLAVDRNDRLYVANVGRSPSVDSNTYTVYEAGAAGDAAPARTIGDTVRNRRLIWPQNFAVDSNDVVYASVYHLAVFPPGPARTLEPARSIKGPIPGLFAFDRHDTLYNVRADTVTVFALGSGDTAKIIRKLAVPTTGLQGSGGITGIALDDRGWLYLAMGDSSTIRVYTPGASDDAAPSRTIRGPHTRLSHPTGLATDRRGRLYVANDPLPGGGGAVRIYAPRAEGEARPVRTIVGSATGLSQPTDIAFDRRGDMYIPGTTYRDPGTISVFRAGAYGNEPPIRTISGPNTLLRRPMRLAFGQGDTLYALNIFNWPSGHCVLGPPANVTVTAYARDMSGDVEPVRALVVTRDGKSSGREGGISGIKGMQVDVAGRVSLWYGGGEMVFGPGASGYAGPIREITEPGFFPEGASDVEVDRDGSVYVANAPVSRICL